MTNGHQNTVCALAFVAYSLVVLPLASLARDARAAPSETPLLKLWDMATRAKKPWSRTTRFTHAFYMTVRPGPMAALVTYLGLGGFAVSAICGFGFLELLDWLAQHWDKVRDLGA